MESPPFDKVMDLLLDTICVVDTDGRYVYVSASCEALLGYAPEELIGRNMIELVHPDDREETLRTAATIMAGQPATHFQNRYVRKDGSIVDIMWSARWSKSDGLRLAVARDITALKRAESMRNALFEISEAAHAADGLPALYRDIHTIIGKLLPAESFSVALHDRTTDLVTYPYFVNRHEPAPESQALGGDPAIADVINSGSALMLTRRDTAGGESQGANWLGVPLTGANGIIGALVVESHTVQTRYSEADKDLLCFVSEQVAAAIERKQTDIALRHRAAHDALTDLPNRTLFYDRMDMAIKRARREREYVGLLYLDLDEFKDINDEFGHAVGDEVLQEVARRLTACVRESDTVGRMGGDEFTILLNNIRDRESMGIVIAKVQTAIGAPFALEGKALTMSVSIGSAFYPDDGDGKELLIHHADTDMYAKKRRESMDAEKS